MVFDSLTFLVFFVVVLGLTRAPVGWGLGKAILLVASYVFYAAWNPPFVALLALSTLTDWFAARGLARAVDAGRTRAAKGWLGLSLAVNLGLLASFKYAGFARDNLALLGSWLGADLDLPVLDVVLPVGISFYTFQTLSYTIDVYRGRLRPAPSFVDFALYVSFFPQLVAGPIVRAREFLPQCRERRVATPDQLGWGLVLLVTGLFEKVVLADALLAPVVDAVYGDVARATGADGWVATLAFSGQILFDFSGYSLCAIGIALCFGFRLPDNFLMPYAAVGFSDFWRRWHVSLSSWLRDYLYISLGGNRRGVGRTYLNLAITMLLGGLWHGASWRFVAWGALHGLFLVVERRLRARFPGVQPRGVALVPAVLGTYLCVCVAWVFFRASTFGDAATLLSSMAGGGGPGLGGAGPGGAGPGGLGLGGLGLVEASAAARVFAIVAATLAWQAWNRHASLEDRWRALPWPARSVLLAALILAILLSPGDDRVFIYFQF